MSLKHIVLVSVWLVFGFITLILCINAGASPYLIAFIAWLGGILTAVGVYEYRLTHKAIVIPIEKSSA